jgi:hypothetical protein
MLVALIIMLVAVHLLDTQQELPLLAVVAIHLRLLIQTAVMVMLIRAVAAVLLLSQQQAASYQETAVQVL